MAEALSLFGVTVPAVATAIWSVIKFVQESRKNREQRQLALEQSARELTWQRTKFLIELSEKFAKDSAMQECLRAMAYPESEAGANVPALKRILRSAPSPCPPDHFTREEVVTREKFDRFLSFLDDLYYCQQRGVFTTGEVSHFGYMLYQVYHSDPVKEYCEQNGFHNVLKLCDIVREFDQA
jgi:hypothetical protein